MIQRKYSTRPHLPGVFFLANPFRRFEVTPDEIRLQKVWGHSSIPPAATSFERKQNLFQRLANIGTITVTESGTLAITFNRVRSLKEFEQALKDARSGKMAVDIEAAEAEANKKWYDDLFVLPYEIDMPNFPQELMRDLIETTEDGQPVIEWLVQEGDYVHSGQDIATFNFDWSRFDTNGDKAKNYRDEILKGTIIMPVDGVITCQSETLEDNALFRYQPLSDVKDISQIAARRGKSVEDYLREYSNPGGPYRHFSRLLFAAIETNRNLGSGPVATGQINELINNALDHEMRFHVRKLGQGKTPSPNTPSGP